MVLEDLERAATAPAPGPVSAPWNRFEAVGKKFRYKKVSHQEIVGEDKEIPWRTQECMTGNHREMMEKDKEMTPWRTPPV